MSRARHRPPFARGQHTCHTPRWFALALGRATAGALILAATATAHAQDLPAQCGILKNHYGPWDYRIHRGETLDVVERRHFTPEIEALLRGKTASIGQDLSYTLRTFPNHHRALIAAERFAERAKTPQPKDMEFTVDCYFRRALAWKSDDVIARMLYARYLFTQGRGTEAKSHLEMVLADKRATALTTHNVGMVAADFQDYELALRAARQSREMGFESMDLVNRLQTQGRWSEAPRAPVEPAAAASASSK